MLSVLALVCLAAGCGSVARVKLSENSQQVAHPATLGVRHPVPGRCATSAVVVRPSPKIAYAAVVARLAIVRRLPGPVLRGLIGAAGLIVAVKLGLSTYR